MKDTQTIPKEELYKMLSRHRCDTPVASVLNRRGLIPLLLRIAVAAAMWMLIAAPLLAVGLMVAGLNWMWRKVKKGY